VADPRVAGGLARFLEGSLEPGGALVPQVVQVPVEYESVDDGTEQAERGSELDDVDHECLVARYGCERVSCISA